MTIGLSEADNRNVVVYANSYEHAVIVAADEFGMSASNPRDVTPEITEYFSNGNDVYAQYDDGTESFVLSAETSAHAAVKAEALNNA